MFHFNFITEPTKSFKCVFVLPALLCIWSKIEGIEILNGGMGVMGRME